MYNASTFVQIKWYFTRKEIISKSVSISHRELESRKINKHRGGCCMHLLYLFIWFWEYGVMDYLLSTTDSFINDHIVLYIKDIICKHLHIICMTCVFKDVMILYQSDIEIMYLDCFSKWSVFYRLLKDV